MAKNLQLTAYGCGTAEIIRHTRTDKTTVWRSAGALHNGRDRGLLRDKTGLSRIPTRRRNRAGGRYAHRDCSNA